ncbi:acyl-CoA dehydrogenase family protein [uncultured Sphingomonas sp.]|uniref:acyl-CoA dehydrogenase family protein n=1 Tax=uncultured Sphingomonas sp. TaxID=158754 RepID=UPI002618F1C9|nr:acyl-CoA dehydrogenase family protein [uncultured Sphingomonas sp.]
MTFARTDEQRMLAETLDATFARGAADWATAIEGNGLDALGIAEEAGGLGTSLRDAAVVAAALGRTNAALPWAEHWVAKRYGARPAGDDASADALAVLHCAEIVGLCRTMLRDTALFSHERRQFGVAIGSFQALRHRMADMAMMIEQAEAITGAAIDALESLATDAPRAVSAARVTCDDAARIVGEGAVQIHGAMGLTAELRLAGYFRRACALRQGDGGARAHLARYAA